MFKIREFLSTARVRAAEQALESLHKDFEVVSGELEKTRLELYNRKSELEDLKLKKKIEEEDIKHMTKIRLEQNEIEFQKKVIEIEKQKDKDVMNLKQQYADKMQVRLETEVNNIKEMYGQILKRLPDVNVNLKGSV